MAPCVPLSSCYSLNTLQYLFLHSYICISAFSNLTLSALYRAPSLFHFTQAELSSISVCECLYTQGGVHVCVCAQGRDCEKWCVFVCETGVFLFLTISLWESVSQLVQPFHVFLFEFKLFIVIVQVQRDLIFCAPRNRCNYSEYEITIDPIYFLITCNNTLSVNDSSVHIIPKKNVVCLCNSSSKRMIWSFCWHHLDHVNWIMLTKSQMHI